jgi:hypothetical protein
VIGADTVKVNPTALVKLLRAAVVGYVEKELLLGKGPPLARVSSVETVVPSSTMLESPHPLAVFTGT